MNTTSFIESYSRPVWRGRAGGEGTRSAAAASAGTEFLLRWREDRRRTRLLLPHAFPRASTMLRHAAARF